MKLTDDFSLDEFTQSETADRLGIKNKANTVEIANLKALCKYVLQPIRERLGVAVSVNSGFRCQALNKAVGGVPTSQHVKGEAVDIVAKGKTARELFNFIIASGIVFDQIILYPAFVHISYRSTGNRNQKLYAKGVKP